MQTEEKAMRVVAVGKKGAGVGFDESVKVRQSAAAAMTGCQTA